MSDIIRVFVNASALDLPSGADVTDAVCAFDAVLGQQIVSGAAQVTDGRGIEVDPAARLASGAILRVAVRARRSGSEGSDADP